MMLFDDPDTLSPLCEPAVVLPVGVMLEAPAPAG
jgi:hypothetical protein